MLALINFVPQSEQALFEAKVRAIAGRLGFPPEWLMAVMYSESGLRPNAVNPNGGATGLIQFMPATAKWIGTSTEALRKMNRLQQLDWVETYFRKWGSLVSKVDEFTDLYLLVFYPKALRENWPNDRKFSAAVYAQNRGIDLNKDKVLTVGEFKDWALSRVLKKMPSGFDPDLLKKK